MPDTKPSATAMNLHDLGHAIYRDPSCGGCQEAQRILDAYAAERMAKRDPTYDQLRAERDAALARAADADAKASVCIDHCTEFEMRAVHAEERVRVLVASIDVALRFMPQHEPHTKILRESRNAKAAAEEERG